MIRMSKADHRNTRTRRSDRRLSSEAKTLSFIFSSPDSSSSRMPGLILEILVIVLLSTPGISPSSVTEGPRSRYCYNEIIMFISQMSILHTVVINSCVKYVGQTLRSIANTFGTRTSGSSLRCIDTRSQRPSRFLSLTKLATNTRAQSVDNAGMVESGKVRVDEAKEDGVSVGTGVDAKSPTRCFFVFDIKL
jgi:hypothetical protein